MLYCLVCCFHRCLNCLIICSSGGGEGEGGKHFLSRKAAAPGCPHTFRHPISAKWGGGGGHVLGACPPKSTPWFLWSVELIVVMEGWFGFGKFKYGICIRYVDARAIQGPATFSGRTPLNKLSVGICANSLLRDSYSTPHKLWKYFIEVLLTRIA